MKKWFLTFLLILFSQAAFSQPKVTPLVAQYYGIWTEPGQTWEQKFRSDTPFDKLNRLYIAFGKIIKNEYGQFDIAFDGETKNAQAIIDRMKIVNPTAEIFVSLGGDGGANAFGGAANDIQFASNVLTFLNRYGLNGIDIDWEMGLEKDNLNLLMTNLSAILHPAGKKLTLAVWPYPMPAYNMPFLKDKLDQINIMSYGQGTDLAACASFYMDRGFPAEKIIGGIETETNYRQGGGTDTLGPGGTIAKKIQDAFNLNLGGMMEWRLDNDYAPKDDINYPSYKAAIELWNGLRNISSVPTISS